MMTYTDYANWTHDQLCLIDRENLNNKERILLDKAQTCLTGSNWPPKGLSNLLDTLINRGGNNANVAHEANIYYRKYIELRRL